MVMLIYINGYVDSIEEYHKISQFIKCPILSDFESTRLTELKRWYL